MAGIPSLYRSSIGHMRDGVVNLAREIFAKCQRNRGKRESVAVLMDDDGHVYAVLSGSGITMLAVLRNPGWLVGVYTLSLTNWASPQKVADDSLPDPIKCRRDSAPTVASIAQDLEFRADEVMARRVA